MLLHFFLVTVRVPLPYGDPVDIGTGTTVAVERITTGPLFEGEATTFTLAPEAAAPEFPVAAAGEAVSVTVTVSAAWVTVTVTGAQTAPGLPPAPPTTSPEFAPVDPAGYPVATWETVMYLVDVEVWVVVVVLSEGETALLLFPPSPDVPEFSLPEAAGVA